MNLKRALEIIDGGARIKHLRYIKANVSRGSGGEVVELINARLCRSQKQGSNIQHPESGTQHPAPTISRNPNHHLYFTRNMQLPNNQVRKVHPLLITHLNQEEVI